MKKRPKLKFWTLMINDGFFLRKNFLVMSVAFFSFGLPLAIIAAMVSTSPEN